jgi:hypothetical protein
MDQSPAVQALVASYGGSDSTRPDFNRLRYVKFSSTHEPRDLGQIPEGAMVLDGLVGAQSGTQTLFFRFYAPRPARIGLRRVPLNPYTDQYISLALRGADGNAIAVQPEAPPAQAASVVSIAGGAILELQGGYIESDYWDEGYAEAEGLVLNIPPVISAEFGTTQEIDSLVAAAGDERPAGVYTITVSSSQWPPLPFRLQVLARPSEDLLGVATFAIEGEGRVGLFDLDALADFQLDASGHLARLYTLGANQLISYAADQYWDDGYAVNDGLAASEATPQVADFTITPTALVQRLSPLQGSYF